MLLHGQLATPTSSAGTAPQRLLRQRPSGYRGRLGAPVPGHRLRTFVHRALGDGYRRVPFGLARGTRLPATQGLRHALGLLELEIASYVRALVEPESVAYDVGASRGYYAVALARRAVRGRVVCFEPDGATFAELQDTLASNPSLAGRIEAVNAALGAVPSGAPGPGGEGVTTLDAYAAGDPAGGPDFLKIDVDGPEHEVLTGGQTVIEKRHPRFIIETHGFDIEANCLKFLTERDYGYRVINQRRVWPEHRPIEMNRWVAAVHRSDPAFPLVCH